MESQSWFSAAGWWAVGLFFGLSIRILWGALRGKVREYSQLDEYVRQNAIAFTLVALCYTALVVMWKSTDLVAAIPWIDKVGILPGQVNAWSILICFSGDVIFAFVARKFGERAGVKVDKPADPTDTGS